MTHKAYQICARLLAKESCKRRFARSACMGIFIAFSPYVGLHTLLAVALCWVFSLNYPITLSVQLLVNNPWTMVPVYGCDYAVGKLIARYCAFSWVQEAPGWMHSWVQPLADYLSMSTNEVWAFIIGGNVLGVVLGLCLYKPTIWIAERIRHENHSTK